MVDGEEEDLLLLARARAGLSPAPGDQERVRRSVTAALAGATTAGAGGPEPFRGAPAPAARSLGVVRRTLAALAIAGGAGSAGYMLGHRAGTREARPPSGWEASSPPASPVPAPPPAPAPEISPSLGSPAPTAGTFARAGGAGGPERQARVAGARPNAIGRRTSLADSLEKEVSALRAIERALRDGQPGLALALLRELDRAVPEGRLVEEREATAAIARCALDQVPFGVGLAEDFGARHPGSVYLERVEQACARRDDGDGRDGESR
jgi:hypothetical protein